MAVQNRITKRSTQQEKAIEYQVNGENVRLTPNIVRQYLTNGNGSITDQEVVYFLNICKHQKLNPLAKDAYLVKYGSQPAAIIVGKDALLKRAMHNPQYAGHQAGVIVLTDSGELEYRTGALTLDGETLVGGWAKTFIKGYDVPIESTVSLREYIGTKSDGRPNSMWAGKPGTMIRKVALVTSLREAFPDELAQLYTSEEIDGGVDIETTMAPVDMGTQEQPSERHPEQETIDDLQQELQLDDHAVDEFPGGF